MPKVRAALLAGFLVGCAGASSKSEPPKVAANPVVCPAPPASTAAPVAAPSASAAPVANEAQPANEVATNEPEAPAPPAALAVVMVDELPFLSDVRARAATPPPAHGKASKHAKKHVKKHPNSSRPYHPDPGIIVDVTGTQGVSPGEAQRVARAEGYWPFRHCYEEGLRRNQDLGGRVAFELTLAADGSVQNTRQTSTNLKDESVVLCVVREAGHLPLSRIAGGAGDPNKKVSIQVTLATGDELFPAPRPMPNADRMREALRVKWPAVEKCYKDGLARHRDLGGRITLRIHARPSGELAEVAEAEPRFSDIDVTRCVLATYRGLKMPKLTKEETFTYVMHVEAKDASDANIAVGSAAPADSD